MSSESKPRLRRLTLPLAALGIGLLLVPAAAAQRGSSGAGARVRPQPQRTERPARAQPQRTQTRPQATRPEATRQRGGDVRATPGRRAAVRASDRALQARLEQAGVLPRIRAANAGDTAVRPLRQRLEEAGAIPRIRTAMADLRQPSRQPRSPRLADLERQPRTQVLRRLFDEESKHRVRLAQLERLEELARRSGRTERLEQIRRLRATERARHERLVEAGDNRLGERGTFRAIVDELETRPADR